MPRTLSLVDSLALLEKYGVTTANAKLASNLTELSGALAKTGFPCVLKVVSKKAVHKTEFKGVYTNIKSQNEAQTAFEQLTQIPGFEAALVQTQITGSEWLIGSKNDLQFGPTIVFGTGGVFVELLKDVSLRVLPITANDAEQMIDEIKHQQLVNGFRGQTPLSKKQAIQTLLAIAKLVETEKPVEMDLNPLIATENGLIAVDARIVQLVPITKGTFSAINAFLAF